MSDPEDNRSHGKDERMRIKSFFDGKEFLLRTPMKRFGQREELIGAALLLLSLLRPSFCREDLFREDRRDRGAPLRRGGWKQQRERLRFEEAEEFEVLRDAEKRSHLACYAPP